MRQITSTLGALLILASLCGSVWLILPSSAGVHALLGAPPTGLLGINSTSTSSVSPTVPLEISVPTTARPITRLNIPSIDLETDVVPAPLVEHNGSTTWDVPPIVAGHAQGTPGAGETGNAVVLGHVTSLHLGNVFEHLDRVQPGDVAYVQSDEQRFAYRVIDVRDVSRTDVGVLGATPEPTLTLITCSGLWLPTVGDYAERLIVRARLI